MVSGLVAPLSPGIYGAAMLPPLPTETSWVVDFQTPRETGSSGFKAARKLSQSIRLPLRNGSR